MLQRVVYIFTFWRHLNLGPMYLWQACQEWQRTSGLATSHPPSSMGIQDLRQKQQPAPILPFILYLSEMGPRQHDLWASNIRGLCTSALLRGRFLQLSPEPGRKGTPGREGLPDAAAAWTPWAQSPARSPHVKVVKFLFCSIVVLLSPFLVIDFMKESCSESPGSGRRGKEDN